MSHVSEPLLSVIVCTYDRPAHLRRVIDALADQSLSDHDYEILVVYDPSVETTASIVEDLTASSDLISLTEARVGLSYARNTGLERARGEYVAFLDDDAIPEEGWLEAIVDAFEIPPERPLCVGGPVYPAFEVPPPDWLPESLLGLPTCDLGDEPQWVNFSKDIIIGTNMAFVRSFLDEIGGFPTELGREKGKLLANEELEVLRKADKRTGIYYTPAASVDHVLGTERLRLSYFLRRSFWQGVSNCRAEYVRQQGPSSRWETAMRLGWTALRAGKTGVRTALSSGNEQRVAALYDFCVYVGYIVEQSKFALFSERHWRRLIE